MDRAPVQGTGPYWTSPDNWQRKKFQPKNPEPSLGQSTLKYGKNMRLSMVALNLPSGLPNDGALDILKLPNYLATR